MQCVFCAVVSEFLLFIINSKRETVDSIVLASKDKYYMSGEMARCEQMCTNKGLERQQAWLM